MIQMCWPVSEHSIRVFITDYYYLITTLALYMTRVFNLHTVGLSTEMRAKSLVSPVRPLSRESHSAPVSRTSSPSDLPTSRQITMWIGSESGV